MAIGNNISLEGVADFFAGIADNLIIEFVPKADSQVVRMLATREDVFPNYNRDGFEMAFARRFEIVHSTPIDGTERTLYLMKSRATE